MLLELFGMSYKSLSWDCFLDSVTNWQTSMVVDLGIIAGWVGLFILLLLLCGCLISFRKSARLVESISNNLLFVSSVVWFLGVVVYLIGLYRPELHWVSVMPRAIISSFKMFVVTHDLARVSSTLQGNNIYMCVFSLVHFAAAFIAFLFIFKMIGYKIKSSWNILWHKWWHAKGKTVHLFWGTNEASYLLAEDIRKHFDKDTIIFVDIDEECDDSTQKKATLSHITDIITIKNSEIARLDAIDALVDHCYGGPATVNGDEKNDVFDTLHLRNIGSIIQKSKKSYFYFLADDEAQNIACALNLQQDQRLGLMKDNKPVIYVHARRDANNEVFDHYSQYDGESQRLKIKIVDSAYLAVASLKQDEGALPVNCVQIDSESGLVKSPFTTLIIGFGGTGQEAFKFLYEYSAFVGTDLKKSPFKCYAIDEKMDKIAGLVRTKMPAITEEELSLMQAAIDSNVFWKKIESIIKDLNYIVIALNNDSIGLSLAVNLFKYALKCRLNNEAVLKIMVRCYDRNNEKRMTEVAENLNKSIDLSRIEIKLYGKAKDLYSCDTILSDAILTEAKEFNRVYENSVLSAEEQWQKNFGETEIVRLMTKKNMSRYHAIYDVNRRIAQNISNSLHRHTKMVLLGLSGNDSSERLKLFYDYINSRQEGTIVYSCNEVDAFLLRNVAMVEHERWIASHKLMGYSYDSTNDCAKRHHSCICPWDVLDEMTQSYDCNVVDTTIKLACLEIGLLQQN